MPSVVWNNNKYSKFNKIEFSYNILFEILFFDFENDGGTMKHIKLTIGLLLVILFILQNPGFSQEEMTLTIEQSVSMALKKNPEIQIAEKELAKSKARIWESYSTILPSIDGKASFQKSWDIQANTIPNFLKVGLRIGTPITA